jgi:poly(beta-D-mannuronate) lyase
VGTGGFNITDSAYVVVQGLKYTGSTGAKVSNCDHCRVSRCRFQLQDGGFDTFTVSGTSVGVRVDHNDFGPKTVLGNTIMLAGAGSQIVQQTRLDHNYFHDVSGGGGNGWETIRAGLSGWWLSSSKTVIEYNLFERCTGDPETISIKSSDNTIRFNTMRDNHGEMTLRHGNRQQVYGNWLLGNDSGIRVCGGLHKIYNNYIGSVGGKGIFLEGGEFDDNSGAPTDHKQVYGVQVLFNTIVSSQGIAVGGSHPLEPKDCIIANNLLQGGAMLSEVAGVSNIKYSNNFVNGGASVNTPGAVKMVDPMLVKMGEIFRFGAGSPAIDAADATYTVPDDIDGSARSGKLDVGADELTMGPLKAPLVAKDVGPASP